jgi:hypothetical protein
MAEIQTLLDDSSAQFAVSGPKKLSLAGSDIEAIRLQ